MSANKTKNSKLSILWVSFFAENNPALHNILNQLSVKGHSTALLSVKLNKSHIDKARVRLVSTPIKTIPFLSPLMFAIILLFRIPVNMIKLKPDFVIIEPYPHVLSFIPFLPIAKLRKIKLVLDIRTTPVEAKGIRNFLTHFWFSVSILISKKLFDGITIITPLMKHEICNQYTLDPDSIGVWTSGVSEKIFNPQVTKEKSSDLRRNLELSGKFIIFYHGIFTATRKLSEVVRGVQKVHQKYSDVLLFLLGSGPILNELKSLAAELDNPSVIFHDPVSHPEVPYYISMSDVCIVPLPDHPYWRHQSPLKLLEYMAMEKPIILTDIPAHRDVLGNADFGIFLSSPEPEFIAKAIEQAYIDRLKLTEAAKSGRETILNNYTWSRVSDDFISYLMQIG
jgi:glycosyltransferase involved in cell wall biosynthesis